MTDDLRHWIGVLFVAAASAVAGLVLPGDGGEGVTAVRSGLLGLAVLLAVIGCLKIASVLMGPSRK